MSISRDCSCYHEAGHAVGWVANGDRLLLVVGYKEALAQMTPEQQEICFGNMTDIEMANACHKYRGSAGLTKREGRRDLAQCGECGQSELSDSCSGCRNLMTNHVACHLAGGAATANYLSEQHSESQSADDLKQVKELLAGFSQDENCRRRLCNDAESRASVLVRRETKAIKALAAALLRRGVLNGPEAEKIVRENLLAAA